MMSSELIRGNVITFASMVLWATTFPVTNIILETWHPVLATAARLWIGALFLLLWMAVAGRLGELKREAWGNGFLVGGIGLTGSALFLVWGLAFADPVTVAIIAATVPLVAALMGVLARTERMTLPIMVGIVMAIAGGIATSFGGNVKGPTFHGGEFLVILANIFWIGYSRSCITRLKALSDLAKTTLTMTCSSIVALVLIPILIVLGWTPVEYELSLPTVGLIVWMAVLANGIAVILWLWGARLLGVTIGSMHQNLVPFYVILLVLPLGGEIHAQQLLGAALVAAGACFAQIPFGRDAGRPTV